MSTRATRRERSGRPVDRLEVLRTSDPTERPAPQATLAPSTQAPATLAPPTLVPSHPAIHARAVQGGTWAVFSAWKRAS